MDSYYLAKLCASIVAPLFNLMGWTYGDKERPDFFELRDTVQELLDECEVGENLGTGRFMVEKRRNEEGKIEATVYLELEQTILQDES